MFSLLALATASLAGAEKADWAALLAKDGGSDVRFGAFLDIPGDRFLREESAPFAPASTTKLFTAMHALETLGADYRFETHLSWTRDPEHPEVASDLMLVGAGDPSWGMSEFGESLRTRIDSFAASLEAEGIRHIKGKVAVISDDERWERVRFPEGWLEDDYTECYGAQAQAFNLQINCAGYQITGLNSGAWVEAGVPAKVSLDLRKGKETALVVEPVHSEQAQSIGFKITGTWAGASGARRMGRLQVDSENKGGIPNDRGVLFYFPVHDARSWTRNLLVASLEERGIRVDEAKRSADGPRIRKSFFSPTLREILVPFLKKSLNHTGDALFKHLGRDDADAADSDLLAPGQRSMARYASQFWERIVFWDGSGVSQTNEVTPDSEMRLLERIRDSEHFPVIWEALPIAGVDGTLAKRMKGTAAEAKLRAKTGTLTGVNNLAGFVPIELPQSGAPDPAKLVPFVLLSRGPKDGKPARAAIDRVGAKVAEIVAGQ